MGFIILWIACAFIGGKIGGKKGQGGTGFILGLLFYLIRQGNKSAIELLKYYLFVSHLGGHLLEGKYVLEIKEMKSEDGKMEIKNSLSMLSCVKVISSLV